MFLLFKKLNQGKRLLLNQNIQLLCQFSKNNKILQPEGENSVKNPAGIQTEQYNVKKQTEFWQKAERVFSFFGPERTSLPLLISSIIVSSGLKKIKLENILKFFFIALKKRSYLVFYSI